MKKKFLLFLALLAPLAFAQNLSQPILQPHQHFVDASGSPCAGCSLYSYLAGTTTPTPTYNSAVISVGTQNTNPVVLDAAGGATIWISLTGYKFVLKDTDGTTLWTVDNVVSAASLGCLGANTIAHGCTGATTSQGAATNIVDGNTIKPAEVLNANVNGVFTVTRYGAVGDCSADLSTSACTDNQTAIQAAIDAAYAAGGSVYFPTNSSSSFAPTTVYYTSGSINPKGVSMFGAPGAQGPSAVFTYDQKVSVRGAPGKDVFDTVALGSPGYAVPNGSFVISDLGIILDSSVDASADFPTRLPGRRCDDAAMDGSTGVVTSAAQCEFHPGDVGQHVSVTGAGPAGATLVTTIASYQSPTQATLTDSSSTSVTGATMYISVMDLSVTQTVGNCAFAYDDPSAAFNGFSPHGAYYRNVVVQTTATHYNNYGCGFFFQANQAPYNSHWDNISLGVAFGFVFAPASLVAPSISRWAGIADFNTFDKMYLNDQYPFLSYDGIENSITSTQIATGTYGPQILSAYGLEQIPGAWKIDIPEQEYTGASCSSTSTGFRIAGNNHVINRLGLSFCPGTQVFQWDANISSAQELTMTHPNSINITGFMNKFRVPDYEDFISSTGAYNATGFGNTFQTSRSTNPLNGLQAARSQYAYFGPTGFGPFNLSRGAKQFDRTHDFLNKGGENYYFNDEDLWMAPQEIGGIGGGNASVVADSSSSTESSLLIPITTAEYVGETNGTFFFIGKQFPAGKFRVMVSAKAASSTDLDAEADVYYSSAWHSIGSATFSSLTSDYVTYSFDADATGYSGDQFRIVIGDSGSPTVASYVAWVGTRVYDSDPYGNYTASIAHNIVAVWNGASGTLVDDGEGGSGYESGTLTWPGSVTITGTYYVDCFTTGWTGGSSIGRRIVATTVGIPLSGTTFSYGVDVPTIAAARGNTIPSVTCTAIQ